MQKDIRQSNGVCFRINPSDHTSSIIKSDQARGDIFIPAYIIYEDEKYKITTIESDAFQYTKIDSLKFAEDSEITTFGNLIFNSSSVKKIQIPGKVKYLDELWCGAVADLIDIEISPKNPNFSYIENKYFVGKSQEKSDTFDVLLYARFDIKEAVIPPQIKFIKTYSFYNHREMTSLIFPKNSQLKSIEGNSLAFASISKLVLPASLETIENSVFEYIQNLSEIEVSPDNQKFKSIDKKYLLMKCDVKNKNFDVLFFCVRNIENAKIPSYIKIINNFAFKSCTKMKSLEFDEHSSLEIIQYAAFLESDGFVNVVLPPQVKTLKMFAFTSNRSLESLTFLSDSVEIDGFCFSYCHKLALLSFPNATKVTFLNNSMANISPSMIIMIRKDAAIDGPHYSLIKDKIKFFDDEKSVKKVDIKKVNDDEKSIKKVDIKKVNDDEKSIKKVDIKKMNDDEKSIKKVDIKKMNDDEKSIKKVDIKKMNDDEKSIKKVDIKKMNDDEKSIKKVDIKKMNDDAKSIKKVDNKKMNDDEKSIKKVDIKKMNDDEKSIKKVDIKKVNDDAKSIKKVDNKKMNDDEKSIKKVDIKKVNDDAKSIKKVDNKKMNDDEKSIKKVDIKKVNDDAKSIKKVDIKKMNDDEKSIKKVDIKKMNDDEKSIKKVDIKKMNDDEKSIKKVDIKKMNDDEKSIKKVDIKKMNNDAKSIKKVDIKKLDDDEKSINKIDIKKLDDDEKSVEKVRAKNFDERKDKIYMDRIRYLESRLSKYEDVIPFDPNAMSTEKHEKNDDESDIIEDDEEERFHKHKDKFLFFGEGEESHQKVICKIGEGATSIAYKVVDERTKEVMCKKVFKVDTKRTTIKDLQNIMKEYEILTQIHHPCICECIAMNPSEKVETITKEDDIKFEDEEEEEEKHEEVAITTFAIYLKYHPFNLRECLDQSFMTNTLKVKIAVEIAFAMSYIHQKGMIHRDLKLENVMLNYIFEAQLIDFGFAHVCNLSQSGESLTTGVGTLAYMSPEMLNEEKYDCKTDVYSFGVLLFVLFTKHFPKQNHKDKLTNQKIRFPRPSSSISSFCIEIIKKCMTFEPSKRPSFDDILNDMFSHSFLLADEIDTKIVKSRYQLLNRFRSLNK